MSETRLERIPSPPRDAPSKLPQLVEEQVDEIWRLHWEKDPRRPKKYPNGRFRFDAPKGEYSVTYCNDDQSACFGEVYCDRQSIPPADRERLLSVLRATRPLRFIPLEDGQALKGLHPELDARISADIRYDITMEWSLALHKWYREADGIRYVARHGTPHLNRCLFLDRCATSVTIEPGVKLAAQREVVIRACDAYGLAPRLFEGRDYGGW